MAFQFDLAKAIDFCDSAFVFLDNDFVVQYLNFKAFELFRVHEETFQSIHQEFRHFNVHDNTLSCLVEFLKINNALEKVNFLKLGENYTFFQEIGNLVLKIKITPIFESCDMRSGSCIEFADVTSLHEAKKQFDNAIEEGIKGHFSYQVNLTHLEKTHPLFYSVYSKINNLFQTLDRFVTDLSVSLEHISQGDLTHCSMELALMPEVRQEQLHCSECPTFSQCLDKNYINPIESYSYQEDNYLHTIKRDLHYTIQNLWKFTSKILDNQKTLEISIGSITESYSEIAMCTETEYMKAQDIQNLITSRIDALNHINAEIDQATHIRDVTSDNQTIINNLKSTLNNVGEQIIYISHIVQTLDNIFSHHVEGLQLGLKEISQGNLGRGIAEINVQANQIITKSRDAMSQIRDAITQMSSSFHSSNSSIDEIVNTVVNKMNHMDEQIQIFSVLMSSIQGAVQSQEQITLEMNTFTQDVQNLLTNTVGQIERMIYSTGDLVNIHLQLKTASKAFTVHNF